MRSDLETSITRTVAYFSYFSYPVTAFEIWKWQMRPAQPYSLHLIEQGLQALEARGKLRRHGGFWTLAGVATETFVRERSARYLNAIEKYKKLSWVLGYLAKLPYIEGIALCNSLVFHHTQQRSDIDLFVVTRPGRLWTTRLLSVLPMMLMKQRPGEATRNPVDISFFISSDVLALESLRIGEQDPYLAVWLSSLVPVYERMNGTFDRLRRANRWVDAELPTSAPVRRAAAYRSNTSGYLPVSPIPESLARRMQIAKLPQEIARMANSDTRVIVRPYMLKFHKNDRRQEIVDSLERTMRYV